MAESVRTIREAIPPRPDQESLLRLAILERDASSAARLVQQWVHRRGLSDLERFQRDCVMSEDPEAGFWLRRQWDDPLADSPTPAPLVTPELLTMPESLAMPELLPAPVPAEDPAPPAQDPAPSNLPVPVLAAELPEQPDPDPLPVEFFTEPLSEELRHLLATPLEDPFGDPAPRQVSASMSAPADPPHTYQQSETDPIPEAAEPEQEAPAEAEAGSFLRDRMGTFSRMKARMRGYLEDAMDALQRTPPHQVGFEGEADRSQVPDARLVSFSGQIPGGLQEAPAPALASADPFAIPASSESAELATQLPPISERSAVAAPSPTTLADLRAWLPDAADDLPRAS